MKLKPEEKYTLTVPEVMEYFSLGENKARQLLNDPASNYTIRNGNKLLAIRKKLEKHLDNVAEL